MANCIILTGGVDASPTAPRIQRSLGPYRIASTLEEQGYTTFVLDFVIHLTVDEIKQVLKLHLGPDTLWVGFSSTFFFRPANNSTNKRSNMYYTNNISDVDDVIKYIKDHSTAKIVYGGALAPYFIDDEQIDYYVAGYADNSTLALTNYLKHDDLTYLPKYETITVGQTERILIDSADYPEPKMDSLTTNWWQPQYNVLQGEGLPIETARGCIFKCKFCNYPLLGKKKGTYLRDPEEIKDELVRTWETTGTDSYYFTDDTFNDDNDKIEALHKVFTSLPFKPKFSAYLRIDLINKYPHQADLLTEMGLIGTYFGLETMQPKSAISIGKGLAPNKVKDRLYWLREKWHMKANMAAGFILGLPYDSHEYFKELISWCREIDNPIHFIDFYPLHLFQRTGERRKKLAAYTSEFSLNPEIYGYEFPTDNKSWINTHTGLNYQECQDLANWARNQMGSRNKFAEFQMITALNTGISLNDLYTMPISEIMRKYPMVNLNNARISEYKTKVGIRPKE